jgi:hypothetical protein
MAGFSRYLQQEVLDHIFKTGAWTAPTHIYVALMTATPSDTGGGTECAGTGYAREICDTWDAATAASPSLVHNTGIIDFGSAGGADWGIITHVALYDDPTAGNLLGWVALSVSKTINNGDPVTFPAGALDVTLD